jgi:hypothetical protein
MIDRLRGGISTARLIAPRQCRKNVHPSRTRHRYVH